MRRFFLLFLVMVSMATASPPALTITATPHFQNYVKSTQEHLSLHIRPDARNRSLCVEVDGTVYQSDCREIEAERSAVREERWIVGLAPGQYEARATLVRSDDSKVTAIDTFCIIGDGENCGVGDGN